MGLVHRHGKPQRSRPLEPDITGLVGEPEPGFLVCGAESTPGFSIGSTGGALLQRGTFELCFSSSKGSLQRLDIQEQPSGPPKGGPVAAVGRGRDCAQPADSTESLCQQKASHGGLLFPRLSSAHRGTGQARTWAQP